MPKREWQRQFHVLVVEEGECLARYAETAWFVARYESRVIVSGEDGKAHVPKGTFNFRYALHRL